MTWKKNMGFKRDECEEGVGIFGGVDTDSIA